MKRWWIAAVVVVASIGVAVAWSHHRGPSPVVDTGMTHDQQRALLQDIGYVK